MKKYTLFFMIFLVTLGIVTQSSCSNTPKEKEFWEVDHDFEVPVDWKSHSYADAFSIMIPPYMKEKLYEISAIDSSNVNDSFSNHFTMSQCTLTEAPLKAYESAFTSFSAQKDSLHYNYASLRIIYMKGNEGDFLGYLQHIDMHCLDSEKACDMLIKSQLGSGTLIKKRCQETILTNDYSIATDICYQRVGNVKGEGPVTVHIFFLQNLDEAVEIVVSYLDKNQELYKDLFNIVNTFEWKEKKQKRQNL